ncbi:MAG: hypothetical protein U0401_23300 [Anaerolineae bacterium]
MGRAGKTVLILLFLLVLLSLSLNGWLMWQWWAASQKLQQVAHTIRQALPETVRELDNLKASTFQVQVQVDQQFPVQAELPFNNTFNVPIQVTIPISQQISTQVQIDPFQTGLAVPVDVNVPVKIEVPIETVVPITIDQTIPISTTVPLKLDVPVAVKLGETELAGYVDRLRVGVEGLDKLLAPLAP